MYPCKTFEDVQMKAMAFVRLEEDSEPGQVAAPIDRMDRKSNTGYRQGHRTHPYTKPRSDAHTNLIEEC